MDRPDAGAAGYLLYVEDDEALARVTTSALERKGFEVTHCSTVEAALHLVASPVTGDAVGQAFSHALLDLKLGAETSLQLVKPIRQALPQCRILLLTGYGSIATAVQAIKLGASNYITKPASVEEIVAAFDASPDGPETSGAADTELGSPSLRQVEWETIQQALEDNGGNISATARQLKMHRRTLQRKLQKKPLY